MSTRLPPIRAAALAQERLMLELCCPRLDTKEVAREIPVPVQVEQLKVMEAPQKDPRVPVLRGNDPLVVALGQREREHATRVGREDQGSDGAERIDRHGGQRRRSGFPGAT